MKKLFFRAASLMIILLLWGCSAGMKDASWEYSHLKDFACSFITWVNNNDIEMIVGSYPSEIAPKAVKNGVQLSGENINIMEEANGNYRVNFAPQQFIIVHQLDTGYFEIVHDEGIFEANDFSTTNADFYSSAVADVVQGAPPITDADKSAFAKKFKNNVTVDKNWSDGGWNEDDYSGKCYINVRNKNSVELDGSDYYITYKYEYLFGEGVHSENCKQQGKTISSNGKQRFSHHYTDDCGPTKVKVHFNLSDNEIYDKYASRN